MKIICVVPTIRKERLTEFFEAWRKQFAEHRVTTVITYDGDAPYCEVYKHGDSPGKKDEVLADSRRHTIDYAYLETRGLANSICRHTDAVRNLGFVVAASLGASHILTLDDDVAPDPEEADCIGDHLKALNSLVCLDWMNTAHGNSPFLRGVPYDNRFSKVYLSHGVWKKVPDFDGETQLSLENNSSLPYTLPYHIGPIPRGALFPLCGMNVMIRAEALQYFYFAPMGPDTGVMQTDLIAKKYLGKNVLVHSGDVEARRSPALHRFADIWMGIFLKKKFDALGWGCYTGNASVLHTRASDAKKNVEAERLGRRWNEIIWQHAHEPFDTDLTNITLSGYSEIDNYLRDYQVRYSGYRKLIKFVQAGAAKS